jgi:pyruvate dehydrogenase E1 component
MTSGEIVTVAGKRIPMVSVHDGEAGLLDNLGSIVGVRHEALAVRKHSKCARPSEIYAYHGIDAESIVEACGKVLSETALEQTILREQTLNEVPREATKRAWTELWPSKTPVNKH